LLKSYSITNFILGLELLEKTNSQKNQPPLLNGFNRKTISWLGGIVRLRSLIVDYNEDSTSDSTYTLQPMKHQ
jgi:hypothetical protein